MKKYLPILIVIGVLGVLGVLATAQYRWQQEVAEADREKMQRRVEMDAKRFAEDFNREIQAAFFNFQTGPQLWQTSDYAEFAERYDYWRSKTQYPELIKEFYFFPAAGDSVIKFNFDTRRFDAAPPDPATTSLRERVVTSKNFPLILDDVFALASPVHSTHPGLQRVVVRVRATEDKSPIEAPEKIGWLAIMLDKGIVTDRIIPDLRAKYFGDSEYEIGVIDSSGAMVVGNASGGDAEAGLLNLSPDRLLMFTGREAGSRARVAGKEAFIFNRRLEEHAVTVGKPRNAPATNGTLKIEVDKNSGDGLTRTQIFSSTTDMPDPWKLNVRHRSGSVAAYINSQRNENMAIGAALFALLAAAIVGISFSAYRTKVVAQRQVDFVSSVSHEFRTPLAVIYSAGENLADGVAADTERVARYGELIKTEGKKLTAMVEQILEFAGANSGRKQFTLVPLHVADVIDDAIEQCSPLIDGSSVRIEREVSPALPQIAGDKDALSRAVQNLIGNAIKYGNGGDRLRVTAANGGGSVKISVEDRGRGIAAKDLDKIFEPFYRTKDVVDAQIHGNGLGLSLVRQLARAHGGDVTARSEPGVGSTFTIELPAIKSTNI